MSVLRISAIRMSLGDGPAFIGQEDEQKGGGGAHFREKIVEARCGAKEVEGWVEGAATFVDVRGREAFHQGHLFGSWSLHSLLHRDGNAATSTSTSTATGLKSLCDLRRVVIVAEGEPLKDASALKLLGLLRQFARPSQLLLLDDLSRFQQRFPFCLRQGSDSSPLPPCPTELLEPGCAARSGSGAVRVPALYVGPTACLEPNLNDVLRSFEIGAIFQLVEEDEACEARHLRAPKGMKLHTFAMANSGDEAEDEDAMTPQVAKVATASLEAAERIVAQKVPCFVCGPWSALVAAFVVKKMLSSSSEIRSNEELCIFLKDRSPSLRLTRFAQSALNWALPEEHPGSSGLGPAPVSAPAGARARQLRGKLRRRLKEEEAEVVLRTVKVVLEKVLTAPSEERFRRLKSSNPRVCRELLGSPEALQLLKLAGFGSDEVSGDLVLASAVPLGPLQEVLQALRAGD
ncbi:PUB domain-containing protein [Durusdinium trenchii]|uniref:PUB domain-containing protein n=1 Tax=Durusdinium trenchii TaxID=1381693 RepID=A0ABP0MTN4_9DINO